MLHKHRPARRGRASVSSGVSLPEGVPIIVYPVRISEQKQPFVFAKTMLDLRRRGHEFLALAVGTGPYLPRLREFVPECVSRSTFAASGCSRTHESRSHRRRRLRLYPFDEEGISLAFYEALAAGVPAVGADVGGQRELVTPECGILVRRGDEATEVRRYADASASCSTIPPGAGRWEMRAGHAFASTSHSTGWAS